MYKPKTLQICLSIFAVFFIAIGLDKGLGGIFTLGLQINGDFIQVADRPQFTVQDNHTRFFGGLFVGLGLYLLYACRRLKQQQAAIGLIIFAVFIGGLARLSQPDLGSLLSPALLPSVLIELIVMPLLLVWLQKVCSQTQ